MDVGYRMNRRKIHDVSQILRPELPVWPGDFPVECAVTASASAGSSVTLHRLTLSTQAGTHAECSRHVRDDARDLMAVGFEAFIGECEVLDVSSADFLDTSGRVAASAVLSRLPPQVERVLLRTFHAPDWGRWPISFHALEPALIDELARRGCRLIGTDAPSIDPEDCKALRSHHACHQAGMAILEGLVLSRVPEGRYELIALPLSIPGVEATPVRAVLREIG